MKLRTHFQQIKRFFRHYPEFGGALVVTIAGLALDLSRLHTAAHWVLGIGAVAAMLPLLWDMYQTLQEGRLGIDILAATAIVVSVVLGQYWAGIVIVLMLTGGESLEDYAEKRAQTELNALMRRAPKKAHLLRGRKSRDVAIKDVRTGDKLIIKPGEVVPVDCTVLEGSASFDESSLTGESLPVSKTAGDEVLSGSVNLDGVLTVKALRVAADSQFEQIIKLVRAAASAQSPFIRLADRYSLPFTLTAFAIAGTVWGLSGHAIRFLEVLVVATPCPLLLAAPIALISGMSRAARGGIIVKTGRALEQLAETKTIAFDKTGTLTEGRPVVDKIQTFESYSEPDILRLASAMEQNSNHVLGRAILNVAAEQNIRTPKARNVKELSGHGLKGRIQGQDVLVGRYSLLEEEGVNLPKQLGSVKQTATYVAVGGQLSGIITFKDEIRANAKRTLEQLENAGIRHTLMITGDNAQAAQRVANNLGIETIAADCLPADKLTAIEKAGNRPLAFVGDGVNDAPVLAAADVGIALGARGSTAASESADVVIMLEDIGRVAAAHSVARRTFFIAKQSIFIGIGLSLVLMIIFATGRFRPLYGAAIQELVDVTVILNALRAHGPWSKTKSIGAVSPA